SSPHPLKFYSDLRVIAGVDPQVAAASQVLRDEALSRGRRELPEGVLPVGLEDPGEVAAHARVPEIEAGFAVLPHRGLRPVLRADEHAAAVDEQHLVVAIHQALRVDVADVPAELEAAGLLQVLEHLSFPGELRGVENLAEDDAHVEP